MSEAVATLIGVLIGAALAEGARLNADIGRQRTQWATVRAMLLFWRAYAETYIKPADAVIAPLGRMPVRAYEDAVAALVAANAVNDDEIEVLYNPLAAAEQYNAGLDLAEAARDAGAMPRLVGEWQRVRIKAQRLVPGSIGAPSVYDLAMGLALAGLRTSWFARAVSALTGTPPKRRPDVSASR
jgi:hypothetical protein